MKSEKLNLKILQVKSFVTDMNDKVMDTVKGGDSIYSEYPRCNVSVIDYCPTEESNIGGSPCIKF